MFSQSFGAGAERLAFPSLFLSLLLVVSASVARAQLGGIDSDPSQAIGTRVTARNKLQGVVLLPTGARLNERAKVRIVGITGAGLFTFTDDNGSFIFSRLAGGSYTVTVNAGDKYEAVTETVDIFDPGRGGGSTQTIYIQLRYKTGANGKTGTIDAALANVPKPALKQYEKGVKASQAGDNKKAVEAFKSAIESYPDFMLAYNELGVQYLRLNQLNDAAEALRAALKLAPDNFTPLLNYGIVLFYQKEYQAAVEHLRAALKLRDSSTNAHFFLARTFVKLNQYGEAEKEFQQVIRIGGPESNESYRYLGGIYIELGESLRAVEALEKYLSLEPNTKDAAAIRQIIAEQRAKTSTKQE